MAKPQNFYSLKGDSKMQMIETIRKGRIYRQTYGQKYIKNKKYIKYAIFCRCSISLKCLQNAYESAV